MTELINAITAEQIGANVDFVSILILLGFALLIGLVISFTYQRVVDERSESVSTTLLLLPSLVGVAVAIIGNNIAGAFTLAGIFSIIKFRSTPTSSRDILFILFCAAAGLACGTGSGAIGLLVAVILCAIIYLASLLKFGHRKSNHLQIKILVPEDMNAEEVFADVLQKYTSKYKLIGMRTRDLGSVFEHTYAITLLPQADKKQLIDELRVLNGNLNINLSSYNLINEF